MFWFIVPYFLLATAIVANKILLASLSPLLLIALRMLGGGTFLWIKENLSWRTIQPFIIPLASVALCTTFINSLLKAYALQILPASKAAFLGTIDPFITALMATALFCQAINLRQIIGITIGLVGAATLCYDGATNWHITHMVPALCMVLSICIGRYGWMLAQQILIKDSLSSSALNAGMMVISGIIALVACLANPTHTINQISTINTIPLIGALLFTTFIGNGVAYPLYADLLKKYPATLISLGGFLIPLWVMVIAWLFLGEACTPSLLISGALIAIGLMIFGTRAGIPRAQRVQ